MRKTIHLTSVILLALLGLASCSKDDHDAPRQKSYTIGSYGQSQITGTASFREVPGADSVQLTIQLQGVSQDGSYPVLVRKGTSIENGEEAYDLGFVDGRSPTLTTSLPMSFSALLQYDGCIDIYRNPNDLQTIVAQSEIGTNETFKSFNLKNPLTSELNGQFRVYKRGAGSYLVVRLDSSLADSVASHPARLYKADGTRDLELNDVSSSTHVSATQLSDRSFDQLIHYDGLLKVLLAENAEDIAIAQGSFK